MQTLQNDSITSGRQGAAGPATAPSVSPDTSDYSRTIRPRRPSADILRGLAALWVFCFHLKEGHHIGNLSNALPAILVQGIFDTGHLGVAIFFVLSGFVIAQSNGNCGTSAPASRRFMIRRALRICPAYYFSIALAVGFIILKNRVEARSAAMPSAGDIALHLLFLQDLAAVKALNTVYWTLCIEVQFYIVFNVLMALIHWLQRRMSWPEAAMMVMASASVVAALWPLGLIDSSAWHATFLPTWHLFLLGVVLSFSLGGAKPLAALYVGSALLLTLAALRLGNAFTLAGIGTSLVLCAAYRWPQWASRVEFRALSLLGLISYSFYLLHNHITGAAFNVVRRLMGPGVASEIAGLFVSLAACIAVAAICHAAVERPGIALGRRIAARRRLRAEA